MGNGKERLKQIASPFSTGGGGDVFQSNVSTYFLTTLLTSAAARGLPPSEVTHVKLQRRHQNHLLDDIIILSETREARFQLQVQAKHGMSVTRRNSDFTQTLFDCWNEFIGKNYQQDFHFFACATNLSTVALQMHYQPVLRWARSHSDYSEFFEQIAAEGASSKEKRHFCDLIRNVLSSFAERDQTTIEDEQLWLFLRAFHILEFDFGVPGSRDYNLCLTLLKYLISMDDITHAQELYAQLYQYASEGAPNAAGFERSPLLLKLKSDGLILEKTRQAKKDFEALLRSAELALKDIKLKIGGIHIDRSSLISQIENLQEANFIEIVGSHGVGKSALLKELAHSKIKEGSAIFLSADRIAGPGWDGFARSMGLKGSLKDLITSMAGKTTPTVFVDGLDRLTDPSKQAIINDILYTLEDTFSKTKTDWKFIATRRQSTFGQDLRWIYKHTNQIRKQVRIEPFSMDEFDFLGERITALRFLRKQVASRPNLRTAKMLQLIADGRMNIGESEIISELDIAQEWWEVNVVAESNLALTRQCDMLTIAKILIEKDVSEIPIGVASVSSLSSLVQDEVFVLDHNKSTIRFSHDLLEEWTICRLFTQSIQESIEILKNSKVHPFRLIRPMQLLSQGLLENRRLKDWKDMLFAFEILPKQFTICRQSFLCGFLHSTKSEVLMEIVSPFFLQEELFLDSLISTVRTFEVLPNTNASPTREPNLTFVINSMSMNNSLELSIWRPLVGWCHRRSKTATIRRA